MRTRYLDAPDGTRLAWDELGDGPTVVLVHGLGSSRRRWDAQLPALANAGFRAARLDLRGFGESDFRRAGLAEFLADLEAFVSELHVERFHLVGHSLGGMLAQRHAIDHQERIVSLVLASTTSHNGRRASAFARVMELFAQHGVDQVMSDPGLRPQIDTALLEAFPGTTPPLEMLRVGVEKPNPSRANAWRACVGFSTKDELSRLRCPVLVMHGSADPLIPFRAGQLVHEAIAQSEWLPFEGAGHSLPKQSEAFNDALVDFLERAEKAQPG